MPLNSTVVVLNLNSAPPAVRENFSMQLVGVFLTPKKPRVMLHRIGLVESFQMWSQNRHRAYTVGDRVICIHPFGLNLPFIAEFGLSTTIMILTAF